MIAAPPARPNRAQYGPERKIVVDDVRALVTSGNLTDRLSSSHGESPSPNSGSLDDDDRAGELGLGYDGEGMFQAGEDLFFSPIAAAEEEDRGPAATRERPATEDSRGLP